MPSWSRLAIHFKNTPVDLEEVHKRLCQCYRVSYCGLFEVDKNFRVYIQTRSNQVRMAPAKVLKICESFGAEEIPKTYKYRDGTLLAERGEFRSAGGSRGCEDEPLEQHDDKRLPPRKNDDDLQLVPVYSGFNRNWKIVSWNVHRKNYKRKDSKHFRGKVLERQGNKCNYCKCEIQFGEYSNADMDHVIGLRAGGQNVLQNVQALCTPCHRRKTALECRRV